MLLFCVLIFRAGLTVSSSDLLEIHCSSVYELEALSINECWDRTPSWSSYMEHPRYGAPGLGPSLFYSPHLCFLLPSILSILFLGSLGIETIYLQHSLTSHRCVLLGLEETKVSCLSPGSPRGGLNGPFILCWRCSQFLPRLAGSFS